MTFTRTSSGLANYRKFFGKSVMIYTEGRSEKGNEAAPSTITDDQVFYEAIFAHVLPDCSVKVKCVGNRHAALDYALKISKSNDRFGIVCIDRDFEGITGSLIPIKCVIKTFGYSWENDLWTARVAEKLLEKLTLSQPSAVREKLRRLVRRLRILFILDASLQPHGAPIIRKDSKMGGIAILPSSRHVITAQEMSRFFEKYRSSNARTCHVANQVLIAAANTPPRRIIQGHIWSNAVRSIIGHFHKQATRDTVAPSSRILLNLALSELKEDVERTIGHAVMEYYKEEIRSALS